MVLILLVRYTRIENLFILAHQWLMMGNPVIRTVLNVFVFDITSTEAYWYYWNEIYFVRQLNSNIIQFRNWLELKRLLWMIRNGYLICCGNRESSEANADIVFFLFGMHLKGPSCYLCFIHVCKLGVNFLVT